jgi:hypothetical protein
MVVFSVKIETQQRAVEIGVVRNGDELAPLEVPCTQNSDALHRKKADLSDGEVE